MSEDFEDFEDLDEYDEDQDIDGESGGFVDPGVEDEEVPEEEAVWNEDELPATEAELREAQRPPDDEDEDEDE